MTEHEKELLKQVYTTAPERTRIDSGELYDYQREALRRIRGLTEYLAAQYPGDPFTVERYEPAGLDTPRDFFEFRREGEDTSAHAMYYPDETPSYRDDFYALLLRPHYDRALEQLFLANDVPVVMIHTYMKTLYGEKDFMDRKPEELLHREAPIRDTQIFTAVDNGEEIRALIARELICGSFRVYSSPLFTRGMAREEAWALWRSHRREIASSVFANLAGKE